MTNILTIIALLVVLGIGGFIWLARSAVDSATRHVAGKHKARARDDRWDA